MCSAEKQRDKSIWSLQLFEKKTQPFLSMSEITIEIRQILSPQMFYKKAAFYL